MNKSIILIIVVSLISVSIFAQKTENSFAKFLIEGGIEYGGDELLEVFFTNGGNQTMKAGQGGYIAVGGEFQFPSVEKILIRTTIGIKYNTTAADNANIRLTRVPINLIGYLKVTEDIRVGGGVSVHQNVQFKGDDFVADVEFTSKIGPRFEIGYKWVALTYTSVNYTAATDDKFSASSLGLSVSFTFPKS